MESNLKAVSAVLDATAQHLVGQEFRVNNFFPAGYKLKMSPFFLLDFCAKTEFTGTDIPRGVSAHPHRGFETVTLAYHGAIAHYDSAGNSGVIYPGDVQWMTAGRGVLHKEFYEQEFNQKGGTFQMVHLWVNLPAKDKMSAPRYQCIKREAIQKYILPVQAGTVEVIAGEYAGVEGNACTFTTIHVYNARLNAGGEAVFSFPAHFNTGFLVIQGSIKINLEAEAKEGQFVYFGHAGEDILLKAQTDSIVLVLSGEPINEPVKHYGPFVMNTEEEIKQALNDYNQGMFGYLEE